MNFGAGIFELKDDSYRFDLSTFPNKLTQHNIIFLGLPQWREPRWKGSFYSKDCTSQNFLNEYSQRLNCVEVSSTFYSPVSIETIKSWKQQVGQGFRFLPKWPKLITHDQYLKYCDDEIKNFCNILEAFDENLGTSLLQLPPKFSVEFKNDLFYFLQKLPNNFKIAIEFRHPSWFENNRLYKKLENYFLKENISTVISDTPNRRDLCHYSFTGSNQVIRFLSDEHDSTDQKRLEIWKDFLSRNELENSYFILHRPDNINTAELIKYFSYETYSQIQVLSQNKQLDLI